MLQVKSRSGSFRVGKVKGYPRGQVWYLCYHEHGQRRRPRVGKDRAAAKTLAAQINGQLEAGVHTFLSFEPISISKLRERWLEHHEHVLRSSVHTINRYRTASDHLLRFLSEVRAVRLASQFSSRDAEEFTQYLRRIDVAPNGHAHSRKRPLMDKGVIYILETCRAMFSYAAKRRHLSAYQENPFAALQIDRIPVEDARPIVLLSAEQETQFLQACDRWQFPLFLTLMLTGLRPGELTHLLLPGDVDLELGILRVRNKPALGWQVKTRNERDVPLLPQLLEVLRVHLGGRQVGPVFLRRRKHAGDAGLHRDPVERLRDKTLARARELDRTLTRSEQLAVAKSIWREMGAVKEDKVRIEFTRVMARIGLTCTTPKVLRHQFATALQDTNVDPLIRSQLMGHTPQSSKGPLGMTGIYTHTRPETLRAQLFAALSSRPSVEVAGNWLQSHRQDAALTDGKAPQNLSAVSFGI